MKNNFCKKCLIFVLVTFCALFFMGCDKHKMRMLASGSIGLEDIAILSIFSFDGSNEDSFFGVQNLGHSFLSVKNVSNKIITVGKYHLSENEEVTIGSWSISSYFGIWYNVETCYINFKNKYDGRVSVSSGLNEEKLSLLNEFILNNDVWSATKNCSYFAINAWNSVVSNDEKMHKYFIYKPKKLVDDINSFSYKMVNKSIDSESLICGYFIDTNFISYKFSWEK